MQLSYKSHSKNLLRGVTLIELLLVVSLVGIVTAVSISVINVSRNRQMAEDSVRRSNVLKICGAIEAFYEGENQQYPAECTAGGCPSNRNPLDPLAPDSSVLSFYLNRWPGDNYVYNSTGTDFSVHTRQATSDNFFKCNNTKRTVIICNSTTAEDDIRQCHPIL